MYGHPEWEWQALGLGSPEHAGNFPEALREPRPCCAGKQSPPPPPGDCRLQPWLAVEGETSPRICQACLVPLEPVGGGEPLASRERCWGGGLPCLSGGHRHALTQPVSLAARLTGSPGLCLLGVGRAPAADGHFCGETVARKSFTGPLPEAGPAQACLPLLPHSSAGLCSFPWARALWHCPSAAQGQETGCSSRLLCFATAETRQVGLPGMQQCPWPAPRGLRWVPVYTCREQPRKGGGVEGAGGLLPKKWPREGEEEEELQVCLPSWSGGKAECLGVAWGEPLGTAPSGF